MNGDLQRVMDEAIIPAFALLPENMNSRRAVILMLAIGLQESGFVHRRQIRGPARGFWQFEKGGGVYGVMNHPRSAKYAEAICHDRGVEFELNAIYQALEHDDVLAAAFARLLLWTDPHVLPAVGDASEAWECYIDNWRPGSPDSARWQRRYAQAEAFVAGM